MTDAGAAPDWSSPEWLAEVAIDAVLREPTEPSGVGVRRLVAGLIEQFAAKVVAAEWERLVARVGEVAAVSPGDPDAPSLLAHAGDWLAARIREEA